MRQFGKFPKGGRRGIAPPAIGKFVPSFCPRFVGLRPIGPIDGSINKERQKVGRVKKSR